MSVEVVWNVVLMFLCYSYVLIVIFAAGKMSGALNVSRKSSRKFLHAMIGNLVFIIPFFSMQVFPALVAAPFVFVTFLASPSTPFKSIGGRLKGLVGITEEGHPLGLVFYAVSYTLLALFSASKPLVMAVGILPMAYGDCAASLIGERWGRHKYRLMAEKSFEGSGAMFCTSFLSLAVGLVFFFLIGDSSVFGKLLAVVSASVVATVAEGVSPLGFDNLAVPALSVAAFLLVAEGA